MSQEPTGGDAHIESLERWFGAHAEEWTDSYRVVRRVNDLVMIARKDIAVSFVRRYVPERGSILDAGCGAGWASLDLARSGYAVQGIDIAPEMIERSEQLFAREGIARDRFAFIRGDLMEAELAEESFDGVMALGVLQYQIDERAVLERFRALLRPGGLLVVTGPIGQGIPNYFGTPAAAGSLLRRLGLLPQQSTAGRTQHRYSVGRARRLLTAAGFEVVAYEGHGFGDWVVIGPVLGFRGERALHRLFTWLARFLPLGRWGNDLVVAARRRD